MLLVGTLRAQWPAIRPQLKAAVLNDPQFRDFYEQCEALYLAVKG
jgi:hypothetical protein